ncbi:MAG: hypothetical protein QF464_23445, partial [Myxococcota bacterium]|nr:hypothetical protein [Myxococcota bacterium]
MVSLAISLTAGCGSDSARSDGDPCTQEECQANLCFDENCLDIAPQQDDDYLEGTEEGALGTDRTQPDTDGDLWIDGFEVVRVDSPHDEDGDGVHDALESRRADRDGDCLVDQKDPDDDEVIEDK